MYVFVARQRSENPRFFKMGGRKSNDNESDVVEQTRRARVVTGRLRAKKVDEKVDTMSTLLTLRFAWGSRRTVGCATQKGDGEVP